MSHTTIKEYKNSLIQPLMKRTLCFLIDKHRILLGVKKKGFGQGKWIGIEGKVEEGETEEQAAIREGKEETGEIPSVLRHVATIHFYFPFVEKPERWNQQVHVFTCNKWSGIVIESEEIFPRWIKFNMIPYRKMWSDAIYWLPQILEGKTLQGDFMFKNEKDIAEFDVREKEAYIC